VLEIVEEVAAHETRRVGVPRDVERRREAKAWRQQLALDTGGGAKILVDPQFLQRGLEELRILDRDGGFVSQGVERRVSGLGGNGRARGCRDRERRSSAGNRLLSWVLPSRDEEARR